VYNVKEGGPDKKKGKKRTKTAVDLTASEKNNKKKGTGGAGRVLDADDFLTAEDQP